MHMLAAVCRSLWTGLDRKVAAHVQSIMRSHQQERHGGDRAIVTCTCKSSTNTQPTQQTQRCLSDELLGVFCAAASYNALLETCYRSNDSDRALDVLDRMADDGVEPDDMTYEIVARKRAWRSYMRKVFG